MPGGRLSLISFNCRPYYGYYRPFIVSLERSPVCTSVLFILLLVSRLMITYSSMLKRCMPRTCLSSIAYVTNVTRCSMVYGGYILFHMASRDGGYQIFVCNVVVVDISTGVRLCMNNSYYVIVHFLFSKLKQLSIKNFNTN